MRIGFYAPFKPLDADRPSGDQVIGRGLVGWLTEQGHQVRVMSRLRSRWIYRRPWRMLRARIELVRVLRLLAREPVDCWLTHHSYYKAPDLLGPEIRKRLGIPYLIFQPSYATKYRRRLSTWPGYVLNRRALLRADHCLSNRRQDMTDLARIVPGDRLHFVAPGIDPKRYSRDEAARVMLRNRWRVGRRPVILSAAMFRDDVKTRSLLEVLACCRRLAALGRDFFLVLAGDGPTRSRLEAAARSLGERVLFVGRLSTDEMRDFYSAGDLFVFPGINESLGMVYLEAQASGLPVVAWKNGGIPGVVRAGETGLLVAPDNPVEFDRAVERLLDDREEREKMGRQAMAHVRARHDLRRNYQPLARLLERLERDDGK